jgi:hypothetical protein
MGATFLGSRLSSILRTTARESPAFLSADLLHPTVCALSPASFDRRHREAICFHSQACHGDLSGPMIAPDRIQVRSLALHLSPWPTKAAPSVCGQIGPNG